MSAWQATEERDDFVAWATEPFKPSEHSGSVYRAAVLQPTPGDGLVWAVFVVWGGSVREDRRSGGAFYDGAEGHPEGALTWAKAWAVEYMAARWPMAWRMHGVRA